MCYIMRNSSFKFDDLYQRVSISHMYLIDILKQRCVSELREELTQEGIEDEDIEEMIVSRLNRLDTILTTKIPMDAMTCAARVWGNNHGNQCRKNKKIGEYCTQHTNEIESRGYLQFRRYDEERPTINENGEVIRWYDGIGTIDLIFRYQRANLHKLLKQRKVTPQ
jgi:hypothetical protein